MPLSGTLDVAREIPSAPRMEGFGAEPWEIARAEILQATFEIDDSAMTSLLPPALHPTIPPVVMFTVARYPDSPVGPFALAQVRLGSRAGVRPRGYLLRAYCDTDAACEALASGWGYACRRGEITLRRYHDRIGATVVVDGAEVLRVSLIDPEPISGADVFYVASMNLARVTEDGEEHVVLVQVDPEYRFHRAERGRPEIAIFGRAAWAAEDVEPVYPVVASAAVCDTGFPAIRYVCDALRPAIAGTRKVG